MNIYDIAEKCGVSIATVSRVLNNNPNVSAATRAKIQAVIDEANYTPSALARSLGTGAEAAAPATAAPAMPTVGVLCSTLRDPYYADIIAGLEEQLRQRGYALLLQGGGDTLEEEQQALTRLADSQVTAILCVGPNHYDTVTTSPIIQAASQVPVILVDGYLSAPGVYCVTADQQGAIAELVELLLRRQRRRVLFLYNRQNHSYRQKLAGFKAAHAAAGLELDEELIVAVSDRLEDVNACIKRLLVNRVTFDAVIGTEDILALGAQKALMRTGLSMPIIGFHNSLTARCATPDLTSVDCDTTALCAAAMAALDNLVAGKEAVPHTIIPTKLVERDSFRNA